MLYTLTKISKKHERFVFWVVKCIENDYVF